MRRLLLALTVFTLLYTGIAVMSRALPGVIANNRETQVDAAALFYTDSELALKALRWRSSHACSGRSLHCQSERSQEADHGVDGVDGHTR